MTEKETPNYVVDTMRALNLPEGSYVVLGSGILGALNLRPAQDIDIVVTPELYAHLEGLGWQESVVHVDGRERKKLEFKDIEAFADFYLGDKRFDAETLSKSAVHIGGVAFMSLSNLIAFKRHMNRPKDQADIALIEEYLEQHPDSQYR